MIDENCIVTILFSGIKNKRALKNIINELERII